MSNAVTLQQFEVRAHAYAFDFEAYQLPAPPPDVFRECRIGGQYARRVPEVGDLIGETRILRQVESLAHDRYHGKVFEIECAGCRKIQLRTSSQLNASLRNCRSVECPDCVREASSGRGTAYQQAIRERVLAGGPLYTQREIELMERDVRNALMEEFGELPEESVELDEVQHAMARYAQKPEPHDVWLRTRQRSVELARVALKATRETEELAEEEDELRRRELGQPLAALLDAIALGDVKKMMKASDDVNEIARRSEVVAKKEDRENDPRRLAAILKAKIAHMELARRITPPGLDPIDAMVARAKIQGFRYNAYGVEQALANARGGSPERGSEKKPSSGSTPMPSHRARAAVERSRPAQVIATRPREALESKWWWPKPGPKATIGPDGRIVFEQPREEASCDTEDGEEEKDA